MDKRPDCNTTVRAMYQLIIKASKKKLLSLVRAIYLLKNEDLSDKIIEKAMEKDSESSNCR